MTTETQRPNAELSDSGLVPSAYTDHDADPDSDSPVTAAVANTLSTEYGVDFPTPTGPPTVGADLQGFRAGVIEFDSGQTGVPDARIELWENGTLVRAGSDTPVEPYQVLSFTWNANELATSDGSLVQCKVIGTKAGGSPSTRNTINIGQIECHVDYTAGSTPVNKDLQAVWDVAELISKDVQAIWDMTELVSKDTQSLWDIFGIISKDTQAVWDITELVGKDIQALWDMSGAVFKDLQAIWDMSEFVNKDLQLLYDLFTLVNKDTQAVWDITELVSKDLQAVWDMSGVINKDTQALLDIFCIVNKDTQAVWDILGGGSINKDIQIVYDVNGVAVVSAKDNDVLLFFS